MTEEKKNPGMTEGKREGQPLKGEVRTEGKKTGCE